MIVFFSSYHEKLIILARKNIGGLLIIFTIQSEVLSLKEEVGAKQTYLFPKL